MPIFSIVVPVYNVEDYIYKCLVSISNQTVHDIEVILIDDGSTDSSLAICESFCKKDKRFSVFSKRNEGQGIARNLGMSYARGEYLCFIDSDDWIEPILCETAYKSLSDNDADFFNFGVDFVDVNGVQVKKFANFKFKELNGPDIFIRALIDDQILSIVWNKVFRRSSIVDNKIFFPDVRAIEDIYFSRAISKISKRVIFSDKVLYHALVRKNSSSRTMNLQSFLDAEKLLKIEYDNFFKADYSLEQKKYFDAHVVKFYTYLQIQSAFRVGSYFDYIKCYRIMKESLFYNKSKNISSIAKLPYKNKFMILLCYSPFMLRIFSNILKFFRINPY